METFTNRESIASSLVRNGHAPNLFPWMLVWNVCNWPGMLHKQAAVKRSAMRCITWLKTVNHFRETLHLKHLIGFWVSLSIRLSICLSILTWNLIQGLHALKKYNGCFSLYLLFTFKLDFLVLVDITNSLVNYGSVFWPMAGYFFLQTVIKY